MRIMLLVALLLALLPGAAAALTVQEVVALSKAGVSDEVLITLIERDKPIFAIDSDQLIALTRDRVSERLVLAMLRSGRQEPPPAPPTAPPSVTHAAPAEPQVLMFGHGPSRPNTYHTFDQLGLVGLPVIYPPPYFVAPFVLPPVFSGGPCQPATFGHRTDRTAGIADASGKFVNNGLLPVLAAAGGAATGCQPAVQAAPPPPNRPVRRPRR